MPNKQLISNILSLQELLRVAPLTWALRAGKEILETASKLSRCLSDYFLTVFCDPNPCCSVESMSLQTMGSPGDVSSRLMDYDKARDCIIPMGWGPFQCRPTSNVLTSAWFKSVLTSTSLKSMYSWSLDCNIIITSFQYMINTQISLKPMCWGSLDWNQCVKDLCIINDHLIETQVFDWLSYFVLSISIVFIFSYWI